jgi:hypothetical protein
MGLALTGLWAIDNHTQGRLMRQFLGVGVAAIALIPCVASVYAAFPTPPVVLCGPQFSDVDSVGRHYMIGNLIGNSGQWVYVAETRVTGNIATGAYIAVVPLSAVEDETIGYVAECHNLAPASDGVKPL